MPSVVVTITMDKTRGMNTWLVRVYDKVEDIENEIPSDTWEAHWIQADADTIEHLEDRLLVEAMKKRHNTEVRNGKDHKVSDR